MKYVKQPNQDVNVFEDDESLYEVITKFYVIKQKFNQNEFPFPPHDTGYIRAFKEFYGMEFSMEEMLELREFMLDDAEFWLNSKAEEFREKATKVNLEGLI